MARSKKVLTLADPALDTTTIEPPAIRAAIPPDRTTFTIGDKTFRLAEPGEWVLAQMEAALVAASEIAPALQVLMGTDRTEITSDMFLEALAGAAPAMRTGLIRRLAALAFIEEGKVIDESYDFDAYTRLMAAAPGWVLQPAVTGFFGSIGLFTTGS